MKRIFLSVYMLLLSVEVFAQNLQIEQKVLENGLKVVYNVDNSLPIVSVGLMFNVGRSFEVAERKYLCDKSLRLICTETESLKDGIYRKILREYSAENKSEVSANYCFTGESFSSNLLGIAMWINAAKLSQVEFDDKMLENLNSEIQPKIKNFEQSIDFIENNLLIKMVNKTYNLSSDKKQNMSETEMLENFYKNYFIPENAALVISGDFNPLEADKYLSEYFANIKSDVCSVVISEEQSDVYQEDESYFENMVEIISSPKAMENDTIYINKKDNDVIFAWKIPGISSGDTNKFKIILSVLAEGKSSRLYKSLVQNRQIATDIYPYFIEMQNESIMGFKIKFEEIEKLPIIKQEIKDIIYSLHNDYISQSELIKAQNVFYVAHLDKLLSQIDICKTLAYYQLFYQDVEKINRARQDFEKITLDDIVKSARMNIKQVNGKQILELPTENSSKK